MDPQPYRKTIRGRAESVLRSVVAFMRRTGAGSIAIAIGALGAGVLLATTLIFPPAPSQQVFQTPAADDILGTPFEPTPGDDAIQVPAGGGTVAEGDAEGQDSNGDSDEVDTEVLGTVTTGSDEPAVIVGSTSTGNGVQLGTDGAQPGGNQPPKDGEGPTGGEGPGNPGSPPLGPATPTSPTSPTKGDDEEVDHDESSDGGDDDEDDDSDERNWSHDDDSDDDSGGRNWSHDDDSDHGPANGAQGKAKGHDKKAGANDLDDDSDDDDSDDWSGSSHGKSKGAEKSAQATDKAASAQAKEESKGPKVSKHSSEAGDDDSHHDDSDDSDDSDHDDSDD